jgi:RHS repeat-associated protein
VATYEYPSFGSANELLTAMTETSADGSQTWTTKFGQQTKTKVTYSGGGVRDTTSSAPDGSYTVNHYLNGQLQSVTSRDAAEVQLGQTVYTYDPHDRLATATDARNGTTTYTYDNADRVLTVTSPAPGTGQSPQVTTKVYDNLGRVWKTVLPDGSSVTNEYFPTGLLKKTSGSRTYPVEYTYDGQGRVKTMKTWTSFISGPGAVTTWNYDPARGFLLSKLDPTNRGPSYLYSAAGRLRYITWARSGQTVQIWLDALGLPYNRLYADGSNIAYKYDRRNRLVEAGSTRLFYNDAGQLTGETFPGYSVTNIYDSLLRKYSVGIRSSAGSPYGDAFYGYDDASRLKSVSFGGSTVTNTYVDNSSLVGNVVFQQNGTTRLAVNKSYDNLNRLVSVSSAPSASPAATFNYRYNDANQRAQMNLADGSFWIYEYDSLGQVKSGKRYWSDATPVPGQQFEYGFDDIGNRSTTKAGGDASGGGLRQASYAPNSLNQYASRTVPTSIDILGIANPAASVKVSVQPAYRHGEYFQGLYDVGNGSGPQVVWPSVYADNGAAHNSQSGKILVPPANEVYVHDEDGNLKSDGLFTYTWNTDNQLVSMETVTGLPYRDYAAVKLDFTYDYLGRRVSKKVSSWATVDNGFTIWLYTTTYVYDGWNLLGEFTSAPYSGSKVLTYTWFNDLSGSLQGAGGVGGLVGVISHTGYTYLPAYDGNGNVIGYVDSSNGKWAAQFEYGPFGEAIRATSAISSGPIPIRWSTKYTDLETDLVYYGRRYYNPSTGRWLSRDPIGEPGFDLFKKKKTKADTANPNLYSFVANDPVDKIDPIGLKIYLCTVPTSSFPTLGIGRHAYLWDDRKDTANGQRECGQESSSGSGGNTSGNTGPIDGNSDGVKEGTVCVAVEDSGGKEDDVMSCCRKNANKGIWIPFIRDCHNKAQDCLKSNGLKAPDNPRFRDAPGWNTDWPIGIN